MTLFKGKTAIVTGGASGIGRALAIEMSLHGCNIVLADLQADASEDVLKTIHALGGQGSVEILDVTKPDDVDALVKKTAVRNGSLDFMFNNAGIALGGRVSRHKHEHWKQIIDVNLMGVINGIQAAYPLMREQGHGHIVNTASVGGLIPAPIAAAYSATKHAVVGLSTALRPEASAFGVTVCVLCPGVVRTPILKNCGKFGKMITPVPVEIQLKTWERLAPMEPHDFARQALVEIVKGTPVIVIPSWWKWLVRLFSLSPGLGHYMVKRMYDNFEKELLEYRL
jgi:NAD(P)-dependent dehydrogenase (short-subunit alcohol dehydrogenase family)